jgi:hypothetical protein
MPSERYPATLSGATAIPASYSRAASVLFLSRWARKPAPRWPVEWAERGEHGGLLPRLLHAASHHAGQQPVHLHQSDVREHAARVERDGTLELGAHAAREEGLAEPARALRFLAERRSQPEVVVGIVALDRNRLLQPVDRLTRPILLERHPSHVVQRGGIVRVASDGRVELGARRHVLAGAEQRDRMAVVRRRGLREAGHRDGEQHGDGDDQRGPRAPHPGASVKTCRDHVEHLIEGTVKLVRSPGVRQHARLHIRT